MDMPERIWANPEGCWSSSDNSEIKYHPSVEYRRADLPPTLEAAKALPEIAALVEAAKQLVSTYSIMEDGDGEPCPDVARARSALTAIAQGGKS